MLKITFASGTNDITLNLYRKWNAGVIVKGSRIIEGQVFPDNEMECLVSIVIPAYNHERWILDCLNSIYAIEYDNLELVIIDDGSDDNTYKLVEEWISLHSDRFVRVVLEYQDNQGICKTLNRLVSLSNGEYIRWAASDDKIAATSIIDSLACLKETGKNFLFSDAALIDENGQIIEASSFRTYNKKAYNKIPHLLNSRFWLGLETILDWGAPMQVVFFRKDALLAMGGLDETLPFEDLDLILRLIALDDVVVCDKVTWSYRLRPKSASVSPGLELDEMVEGFLKSYDKSVHTLSGLTRMLTLLRINALRKDRGEIVRFAYRVLVRLIRMVYRGGKRIMVLYYRL